jgi:hypothetical protein
MRPSCSEIIGIRCAAIRFFGACRRQIAQFPAPYGPSYDLKLPTIRMDLANRIRGVWPPRREQIRFAGIWLDQNR